MQAERGRTTERRSGTRAAMTFTKLPSARAGQTASTPRATSTSALAVRDQYKQPGVGVPPGHRAIPRAVGDGAELRVLDQDGPGDVERALAVVGVGAAVVDDDASVDVDRSLDGENAGRSVPAQLAARVLAGVREARSEIEDRQHAVV